SIELFRHELGVELGPELYEASRMEPELRGTTRAAGGAASVQALMESGQAAMTAGAIDAGRERLRNAGATARGSKGPGLEARGLLALGVALVHAAKSRDEEGSAALHRAIAVAETVGDRGVAASAHRELGFVALLRGDYPRGDTWLRAAAELADGD